MAGTAAHDVTHTPDGSSVARSQTIKTNYHCDHRDKQEAANQLTCCESRPCAPPKSELIVTDT